MFEAFIQTSKIRARGPDFEKRQFFGD